jgi:hypothetical protein
MAYVSKTFRLSAAFAASAMVFGSPAAAAAPTGLIAADPLVSLSLFGTSSSRAAVCAASVAAAGAAATAGQPAGGCVLPVLGSPPPVAEVPPVGIVPPVAAGVGGLGILPLAALAALAAFGIYRFVIKDKDKDEPVSPA